MDCTAEPADCRCTRHIGSRFALRLAGACGAVATILCSPAFANCDSSAPGSNTTVTCSPPTADTTGVTASGGSTNVTVNVQTGGAINVNNGNSGITIRDQSTVTNRGTITQATAGPDGVVISGSSNTVTNIGTISTTAFQSDGIFVNGGSNNTLVNETGAMITTSGGNADGLYVFNNGTSNTLINRGTIITGTNSYPMEVVGNLNVMTNAGTLTTTGTTSVGMSATGNSNRVTNSGTIMTMAGGSHGIQAIGGDNNTISNSGSVTVNGSNTRAISLVGSNGVVINTGSLTATGNGGITVVIQGTNDWLTNSGTIRATGTGGNAVFSNTLLGNTATIQNFAGGQIISTQGDALQTLSGSTTIVNAGLIQGGSGVALNGGAAVTGAINFILQTGSQIVGSVNGGLGANQVRLQGNGLVANAFTRFQTLTMEGSDWTWNGTGEFTNTSVNSGTLRLQSAPDRPGHGRRRRHAGGARPNPECGRDQQWPRALRSS